MSPLRKGLRRIVIAVALTLLLLGMLAAGGSTQPMGERLAVSAALAAIVVGVLPRLWSRERS